MSDPTPSSASGSQVDLYVSYDPADADVVKGVAERLRERGVGLRLAGAAQEDRQAAGRAIRDCRNVAVFIGARGLTTRQRRESSLALELQLERPQLGVIPVLLPGAEPPLDFLSLVTWVDLGPGAIDEIAIDILVCATEGRAPGGALRERIDRIRSTLCPYRGLRAFREEDAAFFFGREQFARALITAVETKPMVAVLGPSGSGKSSVVQAAVIPALRRGGWTAVSLTPGSRPVESLEAALGPPGDGGSRGEPTRRLIFVDQWEELYTACDDIGEREAFAGALLEAVHRDGAKVLLTMRAGFLDALMSTSALASRLHEALVWLPAIGDEDLARCIVEPARVVGLSVEAGLAQTLVREVRGAPGRLCLLEFALTEMWQRRSGSTLGLRDLEAIGFVSGSIDRYAESVFGALSPADRERCRALFLLFVAVGDHVPARRKVAQDSLPGDCADLVGRLVESRLLVACTDARSGKQLFEPSHDALLRHWKRARDWIVGEPGFLLWRQQVATLVSAWDEKRRPDVLLRGVALSEGRRWQASHRDLLTRGEHGLVEASARAARRRRFAGWGAGAAVVTAICVLLLGTISKTVQRAERIAAARSEQVLGQAERARDPVIATLLVAELAGRPEPPDGIARARTILGRAIPSRILRGHLGPVGRVDFSRSGTMVSASTDGTAKLWSTVTFSEIATLEHPDAVVAAKFDAAGRRVLTLAEDEIARIWHLPGPGAPVELAHEDDVLDADFSADGMLVATGGADGVARIWSVVDGTLRAELDQETAVEVVVFGARNDVVATLGADRRARLWSRDRAGADAWKPRVVGRETLADRVRRALGSGVVTVVTLDAARVVTGTTDGAIVAQTLADLGVEASASAGAMVTSVALDATGRWFASSASGQILREDGRRGMPKIVISHLEGLKRTEKYATATRGFEARAAVERVDVDDAGRYFAALTRDRMGELWSVGQGERIAALDHERPALWIAIDSTGELVAMPYADGTIRIWSVPLLVATRERAPPVTWTAAVDRHRERAVGALTASQRARWLGER